MNKEEKIESWEERSRRQFLSIFEKHLDSWEIPNTNAYDLNTVIGGEECIWEFKNTNTVTLDQYKKMGGMIDVYKWNKLREYAKTKRVYYMRFYTDGWAIWAIHKLKDNDAKYFNLPRNNTTFDSSGVKADSYCIPFSKAQIHRG